MHSYDVYTGMLITQLIKELLALRCSVIVLSATLTQARRRELIGAAGGDAAFATSSSYPLLTVVRPGVPVVETPVGATASRFMKLRTTALSEAHGGWFRLLGLAWGRSFVVPSHGGCPPVDLKELLN